MLQGGEGLKQPSAGAGPRLARVDVAVDAGIYPHAPIGVGLLNGLLLRDEVTRRL